MISKKLAVLAAAVALAASGASYGADPAGAGTGAQAGAYAGLTDMRAANGGAILSQAGQSNPDVKSLMGGGSNGVSPDVTNITNTTGTTGTTGTGTTGSNSSSGDSLLMHGTGVSHQALLAGGNEVSSDGKADAGDPDGNGAASISIDPEAGKLCFALVVNNLDTPVAAHIHQGGAGKNGPVVVTLKAPDSGDPGASSGCVDNVDRALLQVMHAHPWAFYVNVHSGAYPDGAARGQLY